MFEALRRVRERWRSVPESARAEADKKVAQALAKMNRSLANYAPAPVTVLSFGSPWRPGGLRFVIPVSTKISRIELQRSQSLISILRHDLQDVGYSPTVAGAIRIQFQ